MGLMRGILEHPEEIPALLKLRIAAMYIRRQVPAHDPDLAFCYLMLQRVSRSFAIVIQQLGSELRDAICIFYLVLRALDTVEDDMSIPVDIKLPVLKTLHKSIYDPSWHFPCGEKDYKVLMDQFHHVSTAFLKLAKRYQDAIEDGANKMGHGMAKFICKEDCSAGACERNWSAYSLIHTKIRNKLKTHLLERLVYCRANLRLVQNLKKLEHPMQVDPLSLEHHATEEEAQRVLRNEEEEIIRMLHRELESVDRRVTRAASRAYDIEPSGTSHDVAQPGRRGGRGGRRGTRRGRGGRTPTSSHVETLTAASEETLVLQGDPYVPYVEPEYDSDGNVLTDRDIPSDSASSSGVDDDE